MKKILITSFSFFALLCLSACGPHAKNAHAPHSPLPEKTIEAAVPDTTKYASVGTATVFLWPEEESIPLIRQAAQNKIDEILKREMIDGEAQKMIGELKRITNFKDLADIQKFIGEHATRLDDIYIGPAMEKYYKDKEENQKQQIEISSKISEDKINTKISEVFNSFSCWVKKGDESALCEKNIPSDSDKASFNLMIPVSCEQMKALPWKLNTMAYRRCVEKTNPENISKSLLNDEEKAQLAQLKQEMINIETEKNDKTESDITFQINMVGHALDPFMGGGEQRLSFFETPFETSASFNFKSNLKDVEKSNIRITFKNNKLFSSLNEASDSVVFDTSLLVNNKKTVRNIRTDVKNGTHNLKFQLSSDTKEGAVLFDIDLKSYIFPHHLIMAGKLKFYDSKGNVHNGIMKVVFVEK